jgi:1-acyl-sn-glycerol-3-phosphate acyltransferase
MAPEGTRSPTYELQPGKEGAALIALRSEATIIPIGITGTHQIKANLTKLQRAPVRLVVGPPFRLRSTSASGRVARTETAAMTQAIMHRLARQLPPEFRGVYSRLKETTEIFLVKDSSSYSELGPKNTQFLRSCISSISSKIKLQTGPRVVYVLT